MKNTHLIASHLDDFIRSFFPFSRQREVREGLIAYSKRGGNLEALEKLTRFLIANKEEIFSQSVVISPVTIRSLTNKLTLHFTIDINLVSSPEEKEQQIVLSGQILRKVFFGIAQDVKAEAPDQIDIFFAEVKNSLEIASYEHGLDESHLADILRIDSLQKVICKKDSKPENKKSSNKIARLDWNHLKKGKLQIFATNLEKDHQLILNKDELINLFDPNVNDLCIVHCFEEKKDTLIVLLWLLVKHENKILKPTSRNGFWKVLTGALVDESGHYLWKKSTEPSQRVSRIRAERLTTYKTTFDEAKMIFSKLLQL